MEEKVTIPLYRIPPFGADFLVLKGKKKRKMEKKSERERCGLRFLIFRNTSV